MEFMGQGTEMLQLARSEKEKTGASRRRRPYEDPRLSARRAAADFLCKISRTRPRGHDRRSDGIICIFDRRRSGRKPPSRRRRGLRRRRHEVPSAGSAVKSAGVVGDRVAGDGGASGTEMSARRE